MKQLEYQTGEGMVVNPLELHCARRPLLVLWLIALLVGFPSLASAQNSAIINGGHFDFSLPGARSLAMGGAFLGLADDATAAYANPAGLVQLGRAEMALEARSWSYTLAEPYDGHVFGPPSGIGIDTVAGLRTRDFETTTSGLSFLSFMYPYGEWSFGFFRHEFPRFNTRIETQGPFFRCSGGLRRDNEEPYCDATAEFDGIERLPPGQNSVEIRLDSLGVSVARSIGRRLSVGVTILRYDFHLESLTKAFNERPPLKFALPDFSEENIEVVASGHGRDSDVSFNVGLLWNMSPRWTLGGVWRQGPGFDYQYESETGAGHLRGAGFPITDPANPPDYPFKVPGTWALGLAYAPAPSWTVQFQYDFVRFSELVENNPPAGPGAGPTARLIEERLTVDNAHRLRTGFEYTKRFSRRHILHLRAGVWYDPDHLGYFPVDDPETGRPVPRWAILFRQRDDVTHWTGGVGYVWRGRFQFDAAADVSEVSDTFSLSAVVRF